MAAQVRVQAVRHGPAQDSNLESQTPFATLQFRLPLGGWLRMLIAMGCKVAHACVVRLPQFSIWPCGLMDKALVLGTKDCRFESCQGQFTNQ